VAEALAAQADMNAQQIARLMRQTRPQAFTNEAFTNEAFTNEAFAHETSRLERIVP
jgi:hypothetical protein